MQQPFDFAAGTRFAALIVPVWRFKMAVIDRGPSRRRERPKSNSCFSKGWVLRFFLPCLCRRSLSQAQRMFGPAPPIEGRMKRNQPADPIPHKPSVNTKQRAPLTGLRKIKTLVTADSQQGGGPEQIAQAMIGIQAAVK